MKNKIKILMSAALFLFAVALSFQGSQMNQDDSELMDFFTESDNVAYASSLPCEDAVIIVCMNIVNRRTGTVPPPPPPKK